MTKHILMVEDQTGTVVNLAARLCAEARDGQILIEENVRTAIESVTEIEPAGQLMLKGLHRSIQAFNVRALSLSNTNPQQQSS